VYEFLEGVKQGYGRFNAAFEALGVEDRTDIANVDHAIFAQIETLLRDACDAKSMHVKNIRLGLQNAGCDLSVPESSAAPLAPGTSLAKRAPASLPQSPQQQFMGMRQRRLSPTPKRVVVLSPAGRKLHAAPPTPTRAAAARAVSAGPPLLADAAAAAAAVVGLPPPPRPLMRQSDSGLARAQQWEEMVSAMAAQAQEGGLWPRLAQGIETEAELQKFFTRRQVGTAGGRALHIASAVKVVNNAALAAFTSTRTLTLNPLKAHKDKNGADTFLFHGCPQEAATNIQSDGLKMGYAANGMLGKGLYGAPDPRKSEQFCKNSANGKFMFVCRFNMKHAQHAGPETKHRNTIFDEFCIYDERQVVVLWMLKLR